MIGTANNDVFTGTFATQTFFGGGGNDTFISLLGRFYDNIDGGLGTDTLDHSASDYAGDTYDFGAGILTTSFANSRRSQLPASRSTSMAPAATPSSPPARTRR